MHPGLPYPEREEIVVASSKLAERLVPRALESEGIPMPTSARFDTCSVGLGYLATQHGKDVRVFISDGTEPGVPIMVNGQPISMEEFFGRVRARGVPYPAVLSTTIHHKPDLVYTLQHSLGVRVIDAARHDHGIAELRAFFNKAYLIEI